MCKITYYVWNKIIQGSLSHSVWKKILSLEKFYTHIVADVADYYQVCCTVHSPPSYANFWYICLIYLATDLIYVIPDSLNKHTVLLDIPLHITNLVHLINIYELILPFLVVLANVWGFSLPSLEPPNAECGSAILTTWAAKHY